VPRRAPTRIDEAIRSVAVAARDWRRRAIRRRRRRRIIRLSTVDERRRQEANVTESRRGGLAIRDLPSSDKPRERLARCGGAALATAELLAVVMGTGRPGASALDVGRELLARFDLGSLGHATVAELCAVDGCGPAKALQIQAAIELGRRAVMAAPEDRLQLSTPGDAARLLSLDMSRLEQEHLRVVLLNVKNCVLGVHEVYKGSVNASLVRVGEVFREPVRRNCPAIIIAHNHPSGDPDPSAEDVHITRQIVQAGKLLDIDVLDHLIIGRQRWISLRERGLGFG
jgi:DNA repair protein RadC